jgi:hypothetical protein
MQAPAEAMTRRADSLLRTATARRYPYLQFGSSIAKGGTRDADYGAITSASRGDGLQPPPFLHARGPAKRLHTSPGHRRNLLPVRPLVVIRQQLRVVPDPYPLPACLRPISPPLRRTGADRAIFEVVTDDVPRTPPCVSSAHNPGGGDDDYVVRSAVESC